MSITSKSTKAEILEEYDRLVQEKEQLQARVNQLQKDKQAAEKKVGKVIEEIQEGERAIAPSTLEGIIETLSVLRPGFGDAVSELSAELIAEATKLAELRRAVEEETQQLKSLHGLEIADGTLAQLIQEYTEKSTTFEAEDKQRKEAFEQEMAETRKTWQKEQEKHARFVKERDDTTKKTEQREAAEYKYDLELQRKLDNDTYQQEQAQLKRALKDFEETKRKEWAEREKLIAEQEQEFAGLQAKVEKFPKELDSAVKKARDEATALTRRQVQVKTDLREKEAEGERRVYELKIQSLEDVIEKQQKQISNLSKQLDAALKQAQDLAVRAIEGASSAGSLQAVREIALEQAKNVQKVK
jgi:chromosome segregation ATPase